MTPISKIKADVIIFDQGNTLVMDPFLPVLEAQKKRFRETCHKYDITEQSDHLTEEWAKANRVIDYPFIAHFAQEEPIIQAALRKMAVPAEIAAELGPKLLVEYRKGLKQFVAADPRTLEVRDTSMKLKAKGKRLGIFSNDREIGLGLILHSMQIRPFFEYVETSESIGIEKPDLRVFDQIISFFRVKPEKIIYLGDDPVRDIAPAKRKGLKAILYKVDKAIYNESWRHYHNEDEIQADAEIDCFSQLLDIIE